MGIVRESFLWTILTFWKFWTLRVPKAARCFFLEVFFYPVVLAVKGL
jgi:hypothetical protein